MARIVSGKVARRPGDVAVGGGVGGGVLSPGTLVFLNSVTATGASQISSGSFASAATAYIGIRVYVSGLRTATISVVGLRTSSDGTNYAASDNAYSFGGGGDTATFTGSPSADTQGTSTDIIALTASGGSGFLATRAGGALSAEISIYNINATSTTAFPQIFVRAVWEGTNDVAGQTVYARRKEAVAQGGILLVNNGGGNFIDGRMDVYGIRAE